MNHSSRRVQPFVIAAIFAAVLLVAAMKGPPSVEGATFTVNTTIEGIDSNPGNGICAGAFGLCYLRAAIQEANALPGPDTINLPAGNYPLSIGGGLENAAAQGDLDIRDDLSINGAGAESVVIDAQYTDRVFEVIFGTVSISGVTLQRGLVQVVGGGGILNSSDLTLSNSTVSGSYSESCGGGILNAVSGSANISSSTVTGNIGYVNGGGICNYGTLTSSNSAVTGNTAAAGGNGGGIYSVNTLALTDSLIRGNRASYGDGGGIYNYLADLTISGTLIDRNDTGGNGGGMSNVGSAAITNSTVSTNETYFSGGGINNLGTLTLTNATIANNVADLDSDGSGGGGGVVDSGGSTFLLNTILAGNLDAGTVSDCSGVLMSQGHNLVENVPLGCAIGGDTTGNILGESANLGPLADNEGPTQTHALLEGSPAIDAGSPDCPPPFEDQRGVARPAGGGCDIGAYESPFTAATPEPSPTPAPTATPTPAVPTPTPATPSTSAIPTPATTTPQPTDTASPTGTVTPTATAAPTPTGTPGSPSPSPSGLFGDVDCDGDVDAVDALRIQRSVAGIAGPQPTGCPPLDTADLDCDGDVDVVDALWILRYVAGLSVSQTEPCPDIGA